MEQAANQATIRGSLVFLPEFSHENHGKRFFRFFLSVPRLSGAVDTLPVVAEEDVLNRADLSAGGQLAVTGQVRSHNIRSDGRRHLLIFVFASEIVCDDGQAENNIILEGTVCREPVFRRTPLGREICDMMLCVPRPFQRMDYLPCILWGSTARELSQCRVRDIVHLEGRLQSRVYTKLTEQGAEDRTAYEISALSAGKVE